MVFTVIKSTKGKDVLIYNGHEYLLKRTTLDNKKVWWCRKVNKFNCSSVVMTKMDEIVKEPNEHTHVGDPVAVRRNVVLDTNTQAASTSHETIRYIIGDAPQPETNDILMRLPKKSTIERRIQRHRKKTEAPMANPRDRNFPIPERYADFILYDSGVADPQRIIAVGNRELISCFRNASIWFGDGTFSVVPEMYFQLYTVHTKIGNNYPPCVYFLLPNKTKETYRRMFNILRDLVPNADPDIILLDFELAARNAFKDIFPRTEVDGCFFHLCQSVHRKLVSLGLKNLYETDVEFNTLVKSLPCLAFVPLVEVEERFNELAALFPDEENVQLLLFYFESTYIIHPRSRWFS